MLRAGNKLGGLERAELQHGLNGRICRCRLVQLPGQLRIDFFLFHAFTSAVARMRAEAPAYFFQGAPEAGTSQVSHGPAGAWPISKAVKNERFRRSRRDGRRKMATDIFKPAEQITGRQPVRHLKNDNIIRTNPATLAR